MIEFDAPLHLMRYDNTVNVKYVGDGAYQSRRVYLHNDYEMYDDVLIVYKWHASIMII